MNIVGISAHYHDSAACLYKCGNIIAAAQEERFSRIKNDSSIPVRAFNYCLSHGRTNIDGIDILAYYEDVEKKLSRQLWSKVCRGSVNEVLQVLRPHRPLEDIRDILGYQGKIMCYDHHKSHAASSFFMSGFTEGAVMTIDGVGEWATTSYYYGSGRNIQELAQVSFPNSLGLLYSTITNYLGFLVNEGEYKVMGLAPYGEPKEKKKLCKLIASMQGYDFSLDQSFFNFSDGQKMFNEKFISLMGAPPRVKGEEIKKVHADIACSLQHLLQDILLEKVNYLFNQTNCTSLCLAGGVALNCVANSYIIENSPYNKVFIQPAANDAGCSLGAALLAAAEYDMLSFKNSAMDHVYLGPAYSSDDVQVLLDSSAFKYSRIDQHRQRLGEIAKILNSGQIVGWFCGRMEFGARALGARSILADARNPNIQDRINSIVKRRESFRPFAPAVLEEEAAKHFALTDPSPFMLRTVQVDSRIQLPGITHVDGSARVQTVNEVSNPLFHMLLSEFCLLTGCPILLNTSFNVDQEPIVCSPTDALRCFISTNIDVLLIENFIIKRKDNLDLITMLNASAIDLSRRNIKSDVYTFI